MEYTKNRMAILQYESPTMTEVVAVEYEETKGWESLVASQGFAPIFCTVLADYSLTLRISKTQVVRFSRK